MVEAYGCARTRVVRHEQRCVNSAVNLNGLCLKLKSSQGVGVGVESSPVPVPGARRQPAQRNAQPSRQRTELPEWFPPNVDVKAWTDMIMGCRSPAELQRCLNSLQNWNKYHMTAAFSTLASFHDGEDPHAARVAAARLLPMLVSRARENLPRLQARSLATVAHCIGTYEHMDKELMAELAKLSEEAFPDFTTQGLANLLWSFARLEVQPSQRWMDGFLRCCQAKLADFKPQEMSIILWSLAKLKFRLTAGKLGSFLQHVQDHLPGYSSHSLSNVLWSIGTAEHRPEEEWLEALANEMVAPAKLRTFTPQGLSQALWALSILRFQPSEQFKRLVAARVSELQPACNAIDLATFLYAYAALRLPRDSWVLKRLQRSTLARMQSLLPSHMAKTIWAFAKLEVVPNTPWLEKLFSCAYQRMDAFNARDLSMFAWGMAKLGIMPPAAFLEVYVQRIEFMAAEFPPQEVANTVWALACFNVRPSSVLLVQLFDATDQRLSTFKASELSQLLWALADRRCTPDRQWVNEFFKVSFLRMPDFSPQGLANIIWALERLHVAPTPAWLYCYVNTCRQLLAAGRLKALDLGSMVKALTSLDADRKLQKVEDFVLDALDALSTMELGSQAYTQQQLKYFMGLRSRESTLQNGQENQAATAPAIAPAAESVSVTAAVPDSLAEEASPGSTAAGALGGVASVVVPDAKGRAGDEAGPGPMSETIDLSSFERMLRAQSENGPSSVPADGHAAEVTDGAESRQQPAETSSPKPVSKGSRLQRKQVRQGYQKMLARGGTLTVEIPTTMHVDLPELQLDLGLGSDTLSANVFRYTAAGRSTRPVSEDSSNGVVDGGGSTWGKRGWSECPGDLLSFIPVCGP